MEINPMTNEFVRPPEEEVARLNIEIARTKEQLRYLISLKDYYENLGNTTSYL